MINKGSSKRLFFFLAASIVFLATLARSRDSVSEVLFERGLQAKKEWRLNEAIRYFEWTLRLERDHLRARFEKGVCHQLQGDFLAAQPAFDALLAESVGDPAFRAQLLNAVGVNRFNFNEPDAAIELHNQSLSLAQALGDRRLEAQALIDLSRVLYYSKGQGDAALAHLQQALQLARALKDEQVEADALRNSGVVYWWHKEEHGRSLGEYYQPALEIYRRLNDLRGAAITLSNIGLIYWHKGDWFQFMKYQSESLELKERIGDKVGLSDSYLYLGQMYYELEHYRKAHEYWSKSLELSRATGYRLGQNEADFRLARVYMRLGEIDKAIAMLNHLLDQDRGNPMLAKYRLGQLGLCYRLKGDLVLARQHYEQALKLDRLTGPSEFEGKLLARLGETYVDSGDWQRASEYLALAEETFLKQKEKIRMVWLPIKLAWADFLDRQGRRNETLKYLLGAAEIASQTSASTQTECVRGQEWGVYDRLFSLLLGQPEKNSAPSGVEDGARPEEKLAFRLREQLRYRSFRNLVVRLSNRRIAQPSEKEREATSRIERISRRLKGQTSPGLMEKLQRAYGDYEDAVLQAELTHTRYQLVHEARPAELEEVQGVLDPETALVEYLYAGDKVFALVITRSTFRSVALPVTKPNLTAKVKLLRALIFNDAQSSDGSDTPARRPARASETDQADGQPVAEDLRQRLIEPLERSGALRGIRRLGLIPYGFLHDLPFAALARAEGGRVTFLVEDYALFYPPSATFLKHASGRVAPADHTMLSLGRNDSEEAGLPPLGFAVEEAHAVAQIFGGQVRVNASASETELKQLAPHFQFIHLATHAVSEPQMVLLSRLKLQATNEDDGNLTVREILDLGLQAELVTLGACQTGLSFSSSGNELAEVDRIGLIEAFLHAGAKSVLASLLPISDRSTLEFMKAFYAKLRSMDKAEALAETQRAMLRGELFYIENNQRHPLTHPRYWAPFILAGDYR